MKKYHTLISGMFKQARAVALNLLKGCGVAMEAYNEKSLYIAYCVYSFIAHTTCFFSRETRIRPGPKRDMDGRTH